MFKALYLYGVGTAVGASVGGYLVLARHRGILKKPFNRGEVVEEASEVDVEDDDNDLTF